MQRYKGVRIGSKGKGEGEGLPEWMVCVWRWDSAMGGFISRDKSERLEV